MGGTLRRWVRRTCLAAASASLLLAFLAPGSDAQEGDAPRPEVFRGTASSLAASVQADREALLPIPELFRFIALDGNSQYESSTQQARASLLFPGNGLILGPSLACGTFGGQFPPEFKPLLDTCLQYKYPLTVYADSFAPDAATSGSVTLASPSDPVSGNATRATAHAAEDGAKTDAAMQDLRVLGLPAFGPISPPIPGYEPNGAIFTVDNATSRTDQRIEAGKLVVDAESTLSGVSMIGGLIRIGSIRSESHVIDDPAAEATSDSLLEVSGVTVGGVPAQITDEGLVVGSPTGGLGPLVQQVQTQLNGLLAQWNVKITTLGAEKGVDDTGASFASVGGLLVEFSRDVQGSPTVPGPAGELDPNGIYTGTIQLGSTAARGQADTFGVDELTSGESTFDTGGVAFGSDTGDTSFGGGTTSLATPVPSTSSAPLATTGGTAASSGGGGAASVTTPQRTSAFNDLFADRLRLLYLALTLGVLALCVTPRLALPARLPRYRP